MGEGTGYEAADGRRHIVERPRLTRLLDDAASRIIMLVAPAGYGKTTLAQQWLKARPHAWYRGTAASADVAALARGLSVAASQLLGRKVVRVHERLNATADPEAEVTILAELFAEEVANWPPEAWLAVDDYQFIADSPAAELFIEQIVSRVPLHLLIASRRRPVWATARRLLYGEVYELDQLALAMTREEATDVLSARPASASGLVALAGGWPAVVGLAAVVPADKLDTKAVPATLHDYLAAEVYAAADENSRRALSELALAPRVSLDLTRAIVGDAAAVTIRDGVRLGFLMPGSPGEYEFHPLVRDFLIQRLHNEYAPELGVTVERLLTYFIARRSWDDAFGVVERVRDPDAVVRLIGAALEGLLQEGRLPTLARWIAIARRLRADDPVIDVAAAEVASRQGRHDQAEALAVHAADRVQPRSAHYVRSLLVAGRAAHLATRDHQALAHYSRARDAATTTADLRQALRGQLLSMLDLEQPGAASVLAQFEAASDNSPGTILQTAAAHFTTLLRTSDGCLDDVIARFRFAEDLVEDAVDPVVRCSFLNMFGNALAVAGRYRDALRILKLELDTAARYRLGFVTPYAMTMAVVAESGLRNKRDAMRRLQELEAAAAEGNDPYLLNEVLVLQTRVALLRGDVEAATTTATATTPPPPVPALRGERLVWKALAFAVAGDLDIARQAATEGERTSRSIEVQTLGPWAQAVIAVAQNANALEAVGRAFNRTIAVGGIDSFVCAYRIAPGVLDVLAQLEQTRSQVSAVLARVGDTDVAAASGFAVTDDPVTLLNRLTRREREVYALLREGLSNREIAGRLYVTEVTVKAHVRSILQKLGVRTRTEAAVMRLARD
jgi:LuxR family maltose regulon positive regulatory protein